ncbi:MAG: aldehyde dehydrogenase family protein, partial [Actinomycetota bacterium]|nr:aldehyde dehydrogenase family protein [Actinomycetota bacterium]
VVGNAVVLKPAEQTPLSALVIGEIAAETLPAGVLNVVSGGAEAGDALVTHPDVRRIAFTGSTAVGRKIQQRAADSGVKHVSLELGGKNAMVVFPDAEIASAVEGAFFGMNFTSCQGQSCGSTSRILVHRSLYAAFLDGLRDRLRGVRVGVAYEAGTEMGPVVSAAQRDRVLAYIASARAEGARLVAGGEPVAGVPSGGYFIAPTAFADVSPTMRIAREEIFGPVVAVLPWDDYDEMLSTVNGVEYGLTASIWTNDIDVALGTARAIDAGYVWINETAKHFWGTPFGGMKASGVGREESVEELVSYCEVKAVHAILRDPRTRFR